MTALRDGGRWIDQKAKDDELGGLPPLRDVSGYLVWWTAAPMFWFFYIQIYVLDWNLDTLWLAAFRRPTTYREAVRANLTRSLVGIIFPFMCALPVLVLMGTLEGVLVAELLTVPFLLVGLVVACTLPANLVRLVLTAGVGWVGFRGGAVGRSRSLVRYLCTPSNLDLLVSIPLLTGIVTALATYE